MSELSFPTNFEESQELPFLDGRRVVPEYLATLMAGIDTARYTYEQAVKMTNTGLADSQFSEARSKMVKRHFDEARRGSG
jgi:hypothetical protein